MYSIDRIILAAGSKRGLGDRQLPHSSLAFRAGYVHCVFAERRGGGLLKKERGLVFFFPVITYKTVGCAKLYVGRTTFYCFFFPGVISYLTGQCN